MQTKPEHITATFAPEIRFDVNLASRPAREEALVRGYSRTPVRLIGSEESAEWRGVRFSALND